MQGGRGSGIRVGCGGIRIGLGIVKAARSKTNYVDNNMSCTGKLRFRVPHVADKWILGKKEEGSSAKRWWGGVEG